MTIGDEATILLYCAAIASFVVSIIARFALNRAVRTQDTGFSAAMRALRKSKGKCFGPKVGRLYALTNGALAVGLITLLGGLLSAA